MIPEFLNIFFIFNFLQQKRNYLKILEKQKSLLGFFESFILTDSIQKEPFWSHCGICQISMHFFNSIKLFIDLFYLFFMSFIKSI